MPDQIISQEGYDKLKKEFDERINVKRLEIASRIEVAKELGDLSENAEYAEAKDEQAFNDGRIGELMALLKNVTVVQNSGDKNKVGMGSKVTAATEGKTKEFTIVSFNEANPSEGKISNESPLGVAFIGKKKGEKITANTPRGNVIYEILDVK
ncbi:transcription elongation factor GreA [Patescibacteria group bacterium]|nr:transcription elongation factor GreA [Patescibacteria group bacterium]MBU1663603.1 transcription elongation factor GreA [Patescibacteria group bacterium]MBU1933912.1 transcription elongation factor GreA [Patescibacteria group bacterium]MBU2007653.1 transcription elongation factor GreA [Patescibacteria group bacterium]MBU2233852.1 transcription elongation factor GreA [Patescibacteria group bacterium]